MRGVARVGNGGRRREMTDRYLPVHHVMKILSCSKGHVSWLISNKHLQSIRIGDRCGVRISEKSLQAFIDSRQIDPEKDLAL